MSTSASVRAVEVHSPCINVCRLDAGSTLCLGCYRSVDEIANWSVYTPAQKQAVLALLPARRP